MERLILLSVLVFVPFVKSEFECPSQVNCTCGDAVAGGYELFCPKTHGQPVIIASVKPKEFVKVQCTAVKDKADFQLLSGLKIGIVQSFILQLCPLPGISYKELLSSMGIPSIKTLQIKSHGNMSNTLTKEYFHELTSIKELILTSNSLTQLPEDLFEGMDNVTWINLRQNRVVLPKGIFRHVPKLEILELGSNNLTYLEPGIFRNLTKLRLLNLWGNRLHNMTRAVFSDVPNLESLDLNSNGLTTLAPDLFTDLLKLKTVNLYSNDFTSLPKGLFLNNPQLEKVRLHTNRRSLKKIPPQLFANLTHLKEVYLNNCNISSLPEDLLWETPLVVNITLQRNLLSSLPPLIFRDNKELQSINLAYNQLETLPDELFDNLEKLVVLNMSHNKLTTLSRSFFNGLRRLQELDLSFNELQNISPQTFDALSSLRMVDLSHNKISVFSSKLGFGSYGGHSHLKSCVGLETVKMSHNNITVIYTDWRISMTNLKNLDLSHNSVSEISLEDLHFLSDRLPTIDLSYNRITKVTLPEQLAVAKLADDNPHKRKQQGAKVMLKGNPIKCDCEAYDLARYFKERLAPEVYYLLELSEEGLMCKEPPPFEAVPLAEVDPRELTCELKEEPCTPEEKCTCYYRPSDRGLLVDCAHRDLKEAPTRLPNGPMVLTHTNHTELDLTGNHLGRLPTTWGDGYSRVSKVYLADNSLTQINITSLPTILEVLNVSNNNITRIDKDSVRNLEGRTRIKRMSFQNNPWLCDCEAKEFLHFLQGNFEKVDLKHITCSNGESVSSLTASDLCPTSSVAIGVWSAVIALLGLLVGGSAAAYYRYQREIKVWLYAHRMCLWFVTEEELDKDKTYDAFISYSHQDEEFVVDHLVAGLENGRTKYKLCLHYRDWVVGDFIPNQIARSVEESRRTIVVLSPNFLESVWGRMEFRTAHSQALSEGRARVIVILYGDVGPTENLDPELKAYLSMNTYVKWGDPWFWDKLRYALPHPPELSKGIPMIPHHSPSPKKVSSVAKDGDKSELVKGSLVEGGATTPPADLIINPLKGFSSKAV